MTLTSNDVDLAWSGYAPSYRLLIGSAPGASDVKSVDLTISSYEFIAPRTANTYYARVLPLSEGQVGGPSHELVILTLDLRNVIDALFFNAGPMSEYHTVQTGSFPASVWPDGAQLDAPVSHEAGEGIRQLAQAAIDDYSGVVGDVITGRTRVVDDNLHGLPSPDKLAPFTIAIRVSPESCPTTAAGCANFGPAPVGPMAAVVNLRNAGVTAPVAHELGHAYGLYHIRQPDSDRPEFRFTMAGAGSKNLSETEKAAIGAARAGGIRAGTTHDQALALGLVLPYSGGAAAIR